MICLSLTSNIRWQWFEHDICRIHCVSFWISDQLEWWSSLIEFVMFTIEVSNDQASSTVSVNLCVNVQILDQLKKCSLQIEFMLIEVVKNIWILRDDAFLNMMSGDFLHQCSDLRVTEERKLINKSYVDKSSQDSLSVWQQCFEHNVCRFLC